MKPSNLTPEQFIAWRNSLGMSQLAASRALGISQGSVGMYEVGKRREGEVKIPILVALGMSAIKAGLTPYEGEKNNDNNNGNTQSEEATGSGGVSKES